MAEDKTNKVPGYDSTRVGDYTILTPDDKKASVFQKVTPREQYQVARDVANRAINEINAIRGNRPSSFTDGINAANIASRRQAAETYGKTLPGGRSYSGAREAAYDTADSYRDVLDRAASRGRLSSTANQIREIVGDLGYGPSIRYPEAGQQVTPTPTDPDPTPTDPDPTPEFETTWKPTENYDGGGYVPGQFGRGPKYAEYEDMFRRQLNEGFTLEEAMRLSRTATPYDWEQAFGSADQWRKIGGGNKQGSGGSFSRSSSNDSSQATSGTKNVKGQGNRSISNNPNRGGRFSSGPKSGPTGASASGGTKSSRGGSNRGQGGTGGR